MAFVNFDRWMDLNPEEKERMGQRAMEGANPSLNKAHRALGDLSAGYGDGSAAYSVADAQSKLAMMGNTGGLAALMSKPHEQQASAFDAALAGNSSSVARARSQNLTKMLQDSQQKGDQTKQWRTEMQQQVAANNARRQQEAGEKSYNDRLQQQADQQRKWRIDNYEPQGASEYAEYSDQVQNNRRRR